MAGGGHDLGLTRIESDNSHEEDFLPHTKSYVKDSPFPEWNSESDYLLQTDNSTSLIVWRFDPDIKRFHFQLHFD